MPFFGRARQNAETGGFHRAAPASSEPLRSRRRPSSARRWGSKPTKRDPSIARYQLANTWAVRELRSVVSEERRGVVDEVTLSCRRAGQYVHPPRARCRTRDPAAALPAPVLAVVVELVASGRGTPESSIAVRNPKSQAP